MSDDLVKRLRHGVIKYPQTDATMNEAANRIVELENKLKLKAFAEAAELTAAYRAGAKKAQDTIRQQQQTIEQLTKAQDMRTKTDDLVNRLRTIDIEWDRRLTEWCAEAADRIDLLEEELENLRKERRKDSLQYLSDVGQMQDTIADLNATLEQIPDHAYNAGMLKGILVGIVDWAYHQENKPEWLDGAEGILREVRDD